MTALRLILANQRFHWRIHTAVGLGVAVAAAVLTGALLVGDSVRGSLTDLVLDRLGRYDEVLASDRFFRANLAEELASAPGFQEHFADAVPTMFLQGTVEAQRGDRTARAGRVTVIGAPAEFWQFGDPTTLPAPPLYQQQIAPDEDWPIALNEELAGPGQLNVKIGDKVKLRIGRPSQIPSDSPLGHKRASETIRSRDFVVRAILPNRGLGRFGLSSSQQTPACAFVDPRPIQEMLRQPDRVNAILLAGPANAANPASAAWMNESEFNAGPWLADHLRPTLADYGLSLQRVTIGDPAKPLSQYFNLTSDRMFLAPSIIGAVMRTWPKQEIQPAIAYLANDLETRGRHVPYSVILGIDSNDSLGPLVDATGHNVGPLADQDIVLIDWAADDLGAKPGDEIRVTYFEPDTTHGEPRERTESLRLKAVIPLAPPGKPPYRTNDPHLTPELSGVTDKETIAKWNLPFAIDDKRIRPRDDKFWTDHRTTPKAYVSLATGRRLWGSRFGDTTSLRLPVTADTAIDKLGARLHAAIQPADLGFTFRPVKRLGLQAASGTTPFDGLFLAFSSFLIAAALMLLAVLFSLGVDLRAGEIGLLLAIGLTRRQVARLMVAEGTLVAAIGGLIGVAAGVGYAWLLLVGLRTWWLPAIGTPFLTLHVTRESLLIGYAVGVLICWLTIVMALRRTKRVPVKRLLAGSMESDGERSLRATRPAWSIAGLFLLAAIALIPLSRRFEGESRAAAFVGSGALTLAAAMVAIWATLRSHGRSAIGGLGWLARRNAARNPGRSTLTIGLTAAASFLIVATSAFRVGVSDRGAGGFDLMAESSLPIHYDLATAAGREELGIAGEEGIVLADCALVPIRVRDGDDASCLNLYRPRQPRILGVPPLIETSEPKRFLWGAVAHKSEDNSPWQLLEEPLPPGPDGGERIPVILDENTARYSLRLWRGVGDTLQVSDGAGHRVTLQVVGLLRNSIFQGDLLMGEESFLKLYPGASGYRYLLIGSPRGKADAMRAILEERLGDYGFFATPTRKRLEGLMAVQNTYLLTFQSLGALGLLLGTLGLAAVQLRAVVERRGELALMRATGFRRRRLSALVLYENSLLLVTGLAVGVLSALVAVIPHLIAGAAEIPWLSLAGTLCIVLIFGLAAGLLAARVALRTPLLPALRGE